MLLLMRPKTVLALCSSRRNGLALMERRLHRRKQL
jgi:hypothetical protein